MSLALGDIKDKEVPNLINKLIRFLGSDRVDNAVCRFKSSLDCSRPVYRDYYVKLRHPWWMGLTEYIELSGSGKSIYRNLSPNIVLLAADAKKIIELQKYMPENVIRNYKGNLLDVKRAKDFLYELHIAWHHLLKGRKVIWNELEGPQHEFTVSSDAFSFNVECKRISVDSFRKIKRGDFYNLVDLLLSDLQARNLSGKVELTVKDRLESTDHFIDNVKWFILNTIDSGLLKGDCENDICNLTLDLVQGCDREVDMYKEFVYMSQNKKHQDHGAI